MRILYPETVDSTGLTVEIPRPAAIGERHVTVFRDSSLVLATQIAGLCCAVVTNFLVAWIAGREGRGLLYLLQVISGAGLTLLNFGLGPASIYYLGRDKRYTVSRIATGLFWASIALSVTPIVVLGPFWHSVVHIFSGKIAAEFLFVALVSIPPMALAFNIGYLCLGQGQLNAFNWLRISPSILFAVFLVSLLLTRSRGASPVAGLWLISIVLPGLYAIVLITRAGGTLLPRGGFSFLRNAFWFGWRSHLGTVTQYLQHRVDVFLVGYFLPLGDLGLYTFAISLAELLWYVPQAIGTVLMPYVAASSHVEANRITPKFCRLTIAMTALLCVTLAATATWVIPFVLPTFQSSVQLLWLLLPGTVAAGVFKVLASDFNGRGKPLKTFYPAAIAFGACLAGGLVVIPRFGIKGEAILTTAGYLLNSALYLYLYSRMTEVRISDLLLLRRGDLFEMNQVWQSLRAHILE